MVAYANFASVIQRRRPTSCSSAGTQKKECIKQKIGLDGRTSTPPTGNTSTLCTLRGPRHSTWMDDWTRPQLHTRCLLHGNLEWEECEKFAVVTRLCKCHPETAAHIFASFYGTATAKYLGAIIPGEQSHCFLGCSLVWHTLHLSSPRAWWRGPM